MNSNVRETAKKMTPEAMARAREAISTPLSFGEAYLHEPNTGEPFKARYAQQEVLTSKHKNTWMCVHRRAGKSYSFSLCMLWWALTKPGCKIILFAPTQPQVDELFSSLRAWIEHPKNEILRQAKAKDGDSNGPPQILTFLNGSTIKGYCLGLAAKGKQKSKLRGLTGDIIFIDEAQDLDESDWKVVKPIMMGDKTRRDMGQMRSYVAGTLVGPYGQFYDRITKPQTEKMKRTQKVIFMPISENKDWTDAEREELRLEIDNEAEWNQEYLLEVTVAAGSVFKKDEVEHARRNDWVLGPQNIQPHLPRFITVDWDKVQCGTNISVTQYDPGSREIVLIHHEEVPQQQFHYLSACKRVQELYDIYQPEMVVADSGAADTQFEILLDHAITIKSPMADHLVKCVFNSMIEIPLRSNLETASDPTKIEKKMLKQVLVDTLSRRFQDKLIQIPNHHEKLKEQLYKYAVVRRTTKTTVYSGGDEHIIDTLLFAMYALWLSYENPFEKYVPRNVGILSLPESLLRPSGSLGRDQDQGFWNQDEGVRIDIDNEIVRSPLDSFGDSGGWIRGEPVGMGYDAGFGSDFGGWGTF